MAGDRDRGNDFCDKHIDLVTTLATIQKDIQYLVQREKEKTDNFLRRQARYTTYVKATTYCIAILMSTCLTTLIAYQEQVRRIILYWLSNGGKLKYLSFFYEGIKRWLA